MLVACPFNKRRRNLFLFSRFYEGGLLACGTTEKNLIYALRSYYAGELVAIFGQWLDYNAGRKTLAT